MAPDIETPRVRSMPIYKRFFDMIAAGTKTIEVRVAYSSMRRIHPGQSLRFECRDERCLTRVKRVSEYKSFVEMLDSEPLEAINPTITREDQLKELRRIFSPEKEALGVLAIEIEKSQG